MKRLAHRRGFIVAAACLVPLALVAAGCGGGDPRQVLRETFDPERSVSSGVMSVELSLTSEGGPDAGNASLRMRGPFEGAKRGATELDMDVAIAADMGRRDVDFEGGLVSSGGKGFVRVGGANYELPARTHRRLEQVLGGDSGRDGESRRRSDLLGRLGIDPRNWLTDIRDEGTQRIGGEEVVVVSGSADVPRMVRDLSRASNSVADATRALGAGGLDDLERSVRSAEFTVFAGAEDRLLRGFTADLALREDEDRGRALTMSLEVLIDDPNEPQSIEAPKRSMPLEDLLARLGIGIDELERSLSGAVAASQGANPYRRCLRDASDADEVRDCAALLGA